MRTINRHALRFERRLSDQELRAVGLRQSHRCVTVVEGELHAAPLLQAQAFRPIAEAYLQKLNAYVKASADYAQCEVNAMQK